MGIRDLFTISVEKRKISCDELSHILCFRKTGLEYVSKHGEGNLLERYIRWEWTSGSDNEKGYDIIEISIKNLEISITDNLPRIRHEDHNIEIEYGTSDLEVSVSLHFKNCHFQIKDISKTCIKFIPEFYNSNLGELFHFTENTGECEFFFSRPQ